MKSKASRFRKHYRVSLLALGVLISIIMMAFPANVCYAEELKKVPFHGMGTANNPYVISSKEDFIQFRNLVNDGESFDFTFFIQETDIDLSSETDWEPIGILGTGNYFWGNYNGNGHVITNLNINRPTENVGLFGVLAGEVANLGIESGSISGAYVGSFASHGTTSAIIYNCFNKANVHGLGRAGGIADNFSGRIINTINVGNVECDTEEPVGILSYDCNSVERCYCTNYKVVNHSFTGIIEDSACVNISDLNLAFFQELYQKNARYEERNTNFISVQDGELCFSGVVNKINAWDDKEVYLFGLFLLGFLILIAIDYYFNVCVKRK